MLKEIDIIKGNRQKRIWDIFNFEHKGDKGYFRNHRSLNCGCSMCKMRTYFRRLSNKQKRLKNKRDLKLI